MINVDQCLSCDLVRTQYFCMVCHFASYYSQYDLFIARVDDLVYANKYVVAVASVC